MKTLLKGTLSGGLIAFVWSMISWSALSWHFSVLHPVPQEAELAEALKTTISDPGVYVLPNPRNPNMEDFHQKLNDGPYAYMLVRPNGVSPKMPVMMGGGFLLNLLIAFILSWILTKTTQLGYIQRILVVVGAVLTGTLYAHLANLNWWFFPCTYTLIQIVDIAIGWTLAGAAMAKLTHPK